MEGKEIRKLRRSLDLTLEKFARLLNVSTMTVWRWEKGRTKPSPLAAEKLKEVQNGNSKN